MLRRRRTTDANAASDSPPDAHELALRLLTARARTAHELRDALIDRGVAAEDAVAEIERLAASGLLDDAAVASAHTRRRLRGVPRAPRAILRELAQRGVAGETAQRAVRSEMDERDEAALVLQALESLLARSAGEPDGRRLAAALARRGFAPAVVGQVLRERGIRISPALRRGGLSRRRP